MKVLVAGATGFVGSRLVRALKEAGNDVQALTRRPEDTKARATLSAVTSATTPP